MKVNVFYNFAVMEWEYFCLSSPYYILPSCSVKTYIVLYNKERINTIVSVVVTYTKCSMGRAKYHLMNGFSKNNIVWVHYSEFHVLNIHQVYISTSSKRKTKFFIKQNNIKYTTINPYYILRFWEVTYFDGDIYWWILNAYEF